ncbi:MAG TPA: hypothetical protein VNF91_07365 [Candidatus Acidoferrum sp.]|nr:hypothetical protein [Candidatus Acidoferrum sp.]
MTTTGRRILGFWVAAVVAGGLLAIAVQEVLTPLLFSLVMRFAGSSSINTMDSAFTAIGLVVVVAGAIAIAVPPAFVLGRRLAGIETPWIVASAAAALVVAVIPVSGWLADWSIHLIGGPTAVIPLVYGVVAGFATGVVQAIVLKRYIHGVAWWIPASTFAGAIVNMASFLIRVQIAGGGLTTQNEIYFMETLIGVVGWLIAGIVTGLVLVRLFGELGPERSTVVT